MVFASESDVKEFNPGKQTYKFIYILSCRLIFLNKETEVSFNARFFEYM